MKNAACIRTLTLLALTGTVQLVCAQIENPVYVDDSPQAWELFRQAQDQSRQNAGEAVRLYQELLDDFGLKLIPISETSRDHFKAVRQRVIEALVADEALLERYRMIQKPAAEELLQSEELERLTATRSLTEPGLDALLRLAQDDLEAGRFYEADAWLAQAAWHPDLAGRRAVHLQHMLGLLGHYLGEPERTKTAQSALAELGAEGQACLAQLDRLAAQDDRPAITTVLSTLQAGSASELGELVGEAIWRFPLEDSLARRRFAALQEDQPVAGAATAALEQRLREADLATATPTVAGPLVYINQGHTIVAINRLTGAQAWSYPGLNRVALSERENQTALDLNVVSVSGDSLVTLTGYALPNSRSESGRVLCLDAHTGTFRWSASLSGLVDASAGEQLFPHGEPVIADGKVFVAARRVSTQSLTSAYVVALDLAGGTVKWVRYITSSGGLRTGIRPFCSLVHRDGSLYLASAVGAAAKLDAATGEVQWLYRFNVPISSGLADTGRRPWEMTGPVVTPRGVIALQPDQRRVVLLDSNSGSLLENHSAGTSADWNLPRYLLSAGDKVFAVGSEIRAFDLENLEHPAWQLPAAPTQENPDNRITSSPIFELRGRVQVAEGALIVPTTTGVLVVDSDTGNILNKLDVQPVGNPLAVESQLLLASGDQLASYMPFEKAERMLRDQLVAAPSEPEPALSLLRLGMRVRNLPLALEAADLAAGAIDRLGATDPASRRPAKVRGELFALLLELAASGVAQTPADGESLYATVRSVAVESQQRVEYLLAYGAWLSDRALARAVETYQAILSDRTLAATWRVEGGTMRPASALAQERLADLIVRRGASAYAPQSDYAAMRLRQVASAPEPDPDAALALAEEFPFADAAIDAALLAADGQMKRGNRRAALAALASVYRAAPRRPAAERLLGKYVSICAEAGWHGHIQAIMRHVSAHYGELALITTSGTMTPKAWSAGAGHAPRGMAHRLAHIGDRPGEAQLIEGNLVPPVASAWAATAMPDASILPPDRALLYQQNSLVLLGGHAEPLWTEAFEGTQPQTLRFDERGILLWLGADPQDPKAAMIEPDTGKLRWSTPRLAELMAGNINIREIGRGRGMREQMPDGEPFDPNQTLPLVNNDSIVLVQRTGGVVAIDLADGKKIRWLKKQTLEQIHFAAMHESALVLAGMSREVGAAAPTGATPGAIAAAAPEAAGSLVPRILVLDPATGQPLLDQASPVQPLGRSGVKWMKITPLGLLIYGTAEAIDAIDLHTGRRLWSTTAYAILDSQRAWQLDDRLVIEDQRSRLRTIRFRDGAASDPFEIPLRGEWEPLELRDLLIVDGRIIAHYPQRAVMFDAATGAVAGYDVITDERDYRWLLPAEDKLILINSRASQTVVGDQPGRRAQQWTYLLYALSENCAVLGEPLKLGPLGDRVRHATIIDGWLLLSTQSETLAIPMPAAEGEA